MRRLQIAALALTLTTGCALRAGGRSDLNDWNRVVSLAPETDLLVQHVQHVEPRNARSDLLTIRGRLIAAGPSEITVRTGNRDARVSRGAVQRVALVLDERDSRAHGTLIGATIGAIFGLGITSRVRGEWESGAVEGIRRTTTAAGAAAGAWADTLRDGRKTRLIYRRD